MVNKDYRKPRYQQWTDELLGCNNRHSVAAVLRDLGKFSPLDSDSNTTVAFVSVSCFIAVYCENDDPTSFVYV